MGRRTSRAEITAVLERCQDQLMALGGVIGVGVGGSDDDSHIHLFVGEQFTAEALADVAELTGDIEIRLLGMDVPSAEPRQGEHDE